MMRIKHFFGICVVLFFLSYSCSVASAYVMINMKTNDWIAYTRNFDRLLDSLIMFYRLPGMLANQERLEEFYNALTLSDITKLIEKSFPEIVSTLFPHWPSYRMGDHVVQIDPAEWYWLYPTGQGIVFMRPEDMTSEMRKRLSDNFSTLNYVVKIVLKAPRDIPDKAVKRQVEKYANLSYNSATKEISMYFMPPSSAIPSVINSYIQTVLAEKSGTIR